MCKHRFKNQNFNAIFKSICVKIKTIKMESKSQNPIFIAKYQLLTIAIDYQ